MRITLWIVIALVLFGGVSNMLLSTGVYDVSYADELYTPFDQEDITMLTEGAAESQDNPIGGFDWGGVAVSTIFGSIISVVFIIPLGTAIGIPLPLLWIFQSAIWIIYAVELYALHKQVVLT